jgi:hypothetical protein
MMMTQRTPRARLFHFFICFGLFIVSAWNAPAFGDTPPLAFAPGERLVYDLSYMGMSAGIGVMEVMEKKTMNGRAVYPIVSTAQSNDFISMLYPVDDRVESYMDVGGLYSHHLKVRQRQGKKRREKTIDFDQIAHRAIQTQNNRQTVFDIPARVQDMLSSLYFFRAQGPLRVGDSTFIDVYEDEKSWQLEIRALNREKVTTPVGTFDTIKVQALVQYQGIFLDKGDVFIWVTDDAQHLPVLIHSKIKIGTIRAMLTLRRDGHPALVAPTTLSGPALDTKLWASQ